MAGTAASIRRRVTSSVRTGDTDTGTYVALAHLVTALLVVVVPVGAIAFGVPIRLLLVGAVALYLLASVAMDAVVAGVCVAAVVTAVFSTRAWLLVSSTFGVRIRVVEVLTLLALALLVRAGGVDREWIRRSDRRVVVGAAAAFLLWAALSASVGNGSAPAAAVRFVATQLRYSLLFVLAALVVDRTDPRAVLAPLAVGIGGTLVFAVDEVFAGKGGYVINLGRLGVELGRVWPSPSLTSFPRDGTILYEFGAFGQNRTMVGLAILFVPLALAAATRSRRDAVLAASALLGLVSIAASGSHAAIIGLYAALCPVLVYVAFLAFDRAGMARARDLVVPVSVVVAAVAVVTVAVATGVGTDKILFIRTNNLAVRLDQYAAALAVAARYPLFGVGGGWNVKAATGKLVHNLFLHHLAATGVPGLLAYLTSALAGACLCVRRCLGDDDRWLWVGVLGSLLGFNAYSLWVVAYRWELLNAAYWLLLGVVIGAGPYPVASLRDRVRKAVRFGPRTADDDA